MDPQRNPWTVLSQKNVYDNPGSVLLSRCIKSEAARYLW
jgi:hypothetical protein